MRTSIAALLVSAAWFGPRLPLHIEQARLLEDCAPADLVATRAPSAIVCLGYACDHVRAVPSAALAFRVEAAMALWRRTGTTLIFAGGASEHVRVGLPTEADIMAAHARRLLTDREQPRVLLERESTSTRENALFSLPLLNCSGARERQVAIVTSSFHQWRARRVFHRAALDLALACELAVTAHPCATAASHQQQAATQHDWLRELAACALYWWRGWL
ncbi:hypothetical protein KFE25_007482 [Diacronema lutheri]|uniref:DUF218 domain-containing protein n=1 Tax=Diacronema lutheri TaxID=2081491 RepID=A0A8J5Y008_DIALT|nr:hypothetical protein KFE25_007482 [Diacronema lutheri]